MARMSLDRANRLERQIRAEIGKLKLEAIVEVSIFGDVPAAVEAKAGEMMDRHQLLFRYLDALKQIRLVVGHEMAISGIARLLTERAMLTEQLAVTEVLRATEPSYLRHALSNDAELLIDTATATRERFKTGDGDSTTMLAVRWMTDAQRGAARELALAAQLQLEEVQDKLRVLNAHTVEIPDEVMTFLASRKLV